MIPTGPTVPLTAIYDQQDQNIRIGTRIAYGREGSVHLVTSTTGTVAKIMHRQPLHPLTREKLRYMIDNPLPIQLCSAYRIAWPTSLIRRPKTRSNVIGYTMPAINQDRYREIGAYFNPARRNRRIPARAKPYTYLHLLTIARNLALAMSHIHAQQHLIGDLNSRNVFADDRGRIAIIDTDSFQIHDPERAQTYRSTVGTPEYTSLPSQNRPFAERDRTPDDDRFALAVMIYQLLFQGQHPFSGNYTHKDNLPLDTLAQRIQAGTFAHGPQTAVKHRPSTTAAIIWRDFPAKQLFQKAFRRRGQRTTAQEWADAIENAAASISTCSRHSQHRHFGNFCTWCRLRQATGPEPFPHP